jgi:transcriptional regulator with XRE-family HTH domain
MARSPTAAQGQIRFGAYLRRLRDARSLSLREVAQHVASITADSAGRITGAYINLLERGTCIRVALPKLLSLAAVYNVAVENIIAELPEPLRSQRLIDLEAWRAQARPVPEPLVRVPQRHERTDRELDELFATRARGFTVAWEWKTAIEREARGFLPYAVLPPLVNGASHLAAEFWHLHPPGDFGQRWTAGAAGALALIPHSPWAAVADRFIGWATRATDAIVSAVRLVSWWTLDFTTSGAHCHFHAADIDARYGFDAVPPRVVAAVRRWQIARFLSEHGAPQNWPPPPDPVEGAREFVEYLLRPQPFLPDHAPAAPLSAGDVCGALAALVQIVPQLKAQPSAVNAALLDGVAALLKSAATGRGPARPAPKSRRRSARRPRR